MIFRPKIPLYYQLAQIIINEIQEKQLQENDKIATEKELCEKYDLSRATVRHAIDFLEKKGYVYKVQGAGTFVSSRQIKQKLLKFYSFTEEMKKQGKVPKSEILSFKKKKADEKIAKELKIDFLSKVFELTRLRLADDEVIMYEKTYIPVNKVPELKKQDLLQRPLYDILQKKYNISFSKAIERFSVISAEKEITDVLNVKEKSPLMKLQRWTYSGMEIIEYTVSSVRGDRFAFEIELNEN